MTDLEKLLKFSQEDVKRVSEEVRHEISRYLSSSNLHAKILSYW